MGKGGQRGEQLLQGPGTHPPPGAERTASSCAAKGAGEQSWAQCPLPPSLQDLLATLPPTPRAQKFSAQLVTCCLAPPQPPSQREDPVAFAARVPGEPADLPDLPLGQKGHLRGEGGPGQLLRVPSVRDSTQAALGGELVSGMGEAEPQNKRKAEGGGAGWGLCARGPSRTPRRGGSRPSGGFSCCSRMSEVGWDWGRAGD